VTGTDKLIFMAAKVFRFNSFSPKFSRNNIALPIHLSVTNEESVIEALEANKYALAVVTMVRLLPAFSVTIVYVALRQDADIAPTSVAALEPRHSALLVRSVAAVVQAVAGQSEVNALAVSAL